MIPVVVNETFWRVIAAARAHSGPSEPFHQALIECLTAVAHPDILAYQQGFNEVHAALYRWDMWAAAYLIGGGCGPGMGGCGG
jgi:Protein of unknown function (DUF4240)